MSKIINVQNLKKYFGKTKAVDDVSFSVSYMFSSMFSEKGRTYVLSGGLLLIIYVLNL